MSSTTETGTGLQPRRVRHQARDTAVLMGFSAATSVGLALGLTLIAGLGR